jgi:phenol hydroxylase P4 protein
MSTNAIGPYDFPPADRVENYGGDINIYCCWEHHLLIPCPAAYRVSPEITLRTFLAQMFRPDHDHHPETAMLEDAKLRWTLDGRAWQPVLDRSLRENGVTHMSYLSFYQPGLDGYHGAGV